MEVLPVNWFSKSVNLKMATPLWYFLMMILFMIKEICAYEPKSVGLPEIEREHDPEQFIDPPARIVNGTEMESLDYTPDFRLKEPPYKVHVEKNEWFSERDRPYRISPHYKQWLKWAHSRNRWYGMPQWYTENLGCYCCTVYKRLTLLAGCAVLTPRHVLTTATSTELVIRDRHNDKTLVNVLGLWYDTNENRFNSSMYATPCRIHYHPQYLRLAHTNASHPLPVTFDIAVWATTYPMVWTLKYCERANSGWWSYTSTVPVYPQAVLIVGFQFVKSMRKIPMPWFKYVVVTKKYIQPCPKNDWGWYHCVSCDTWGKFGVESGAAWHRSTDGGWVRDGLAGIAAFSLKLRSDEIVHYFTVLNVHVVLDFLYDAYMGRLPYEYLDQRFHNNQWLAPRPKTWYYIEWKYPRGEEKYFDKLPYYK